MQYNVTISIPDELLKLLAAARLISNPEVQALIGLQATDVKPSEPMHDYNALLQLSMTAAKDATKKDAVRAELDKRGIKKLSDLPLEQYDDFAVFLQKLINKKAK